MNFAPTTRLILSPLLLALASVAQAQPTSQSATRPSTISVESLTLHPSPATRPRLQYQLLPDVGDQHPGNAVTLYLLARRSWPDQPTTNDVLSPENGKYNYLDTPTEEFPQKYTQRLLDAYKDTLSYAEAGARRRTATWDTGWREPGLSVVSEFSYLNDLRHVANLLNFRARTEVAAHNWRAAEHTIQSCLAITQHTASSQQAIHALVATAFEEVTLHRGIQEWIERGDSPNLYWALTDLPPSFVNLESVSHAERVGREQLPSQLALGLNGKLPPDQWRNVLREMVGMLQDRRPPYKRDPAAIESETTRLANSAYDRARDAALASGTAAQSLDAMSHEQVVATYFYRQFESANHDLWASFALPYPQAIEQCQRVWRELAPDQMPARDNPVIQAQLVVYDNVRIGVRNEYRDPALINVRYQIARSERMLALFRIIEAIRDFAASHNGKPPTSLDQITDLPIPLDPITGKAFEYRSEGPKAILDAPAPAFRSPASGWRYELIFVK